ncbi:MAG: MATE family efflux transporter [Olsenella sp.]|nr:MATE family efflux transporter [Olsenella sp.]
MVAQERPSEKNAHGAAEGRSSSEASGDGAASVAQDPRELFLATTPTRLFFTVAVPGALSMLASALYDVLDGVLVGQMLGATAFAAVNLAMPFVILVFAVGDLVGVGSSVPIAIALGAREDDRANNVFTCAVLGILVLGALLGAAFWAAAPHIMRAMGATGELAEMATTFLRVYAVGAPVTSMMFAVDNFLKLCGKIGHSLGLNVFMAGLGAVAEYLLIRFGLGVFGAALGYCVALAASAVVGMLPFALGRYKLRFVRPRPSRRLVRQVFAAGLPAFLNNVAGRVTSVLLNTALLEQGGADAVAVYGALMYASGMVFPLIYGVSDSLQPAVGYNLGAGQVVRVVKLEKRAFAACAVLSVSMASAMLLFPAEITRMFMADASDAILALASRAFPLFSIAYFLRWLPMATQSFYTAIEEPRFASLLSLVSVLVAPVVVLVLLKPWGLDGLWLNMPVATLASTALAAFMLFRLRKRLRGEA